MFFSIITKNSNRETLTKNLVIFRRKDGIKYEKLEYFEASPKNRIFKRGYEKPNIEGEIA